MKCRVLPQLCDSFTGIVFSSEHSKLVLQTAFSRMVGNSEFSVEVAKHYMTGQLMTKNQMRGFV
jgi:hypothetical protein